MTQRLIYDLTTSWLWDLHAVGITRVEKELAKALRQKADWEVCFCLYLKEIDCFVELPQEVAADFLQYETRFSIEKAITDGGVFKILQFKSTDWYISVGMDWDDKNLITLYNRKKKSGFHVGLICYDMIPVKLPSYCVGRVAEKFPSHIHQLAWCADLIFCISEATRLDLVTFIAEISAPQRVTKRIMLAPNVLQGSGRRPTGFQGGKFVLFVSSIEPRKNHIMLSRAFLNVTSRLSDPPQLVFAGMLAWGTEQLRGELKNNDHPTDSIKLLSGVNDLELSWLYQNSLFTVYPSLFEGWGLPIAESLGYGKFCIASNTSSMPEVGSDFCEYADPYNQTAWEQLLTKFILRPDLVAAREANIRENHNPRSWSAVANEIVESISEM